MALLCFLLIQFLIVLAHTIVNHYDSAGSTVDYYNLVFGTWRRCETNCSETFGYATSIHSVNTIQTLYKLCKNDRWNKTISYDCYIGLRMVDSSYEWIDGTSFDIKLINSSSLWCEGSIPYNTGSNMSIAYIDSKNNCWNYTFDLNKQNYCICGPPVYGASDFFWIEVFYIPMIIIISVVAFAIYTLMQLCYNLFVTNLNWIIEPTFMVKATAILLPILIIISGCMASAFMILIYSTYLDTGILPPIYLDAEFYPSGYHTAGYLAYFVMLIYFFIAPIGYTHVLVRLQNVINQNEFMEQMVKKYCWSKGIFSFCCWIMIIMDFLLPLLRALDVNYGNYDNWRNRTSWILLGLYGCNELLLNIGLLCLYSKGLENYAFKHYFRKDVAINNLKKMYLDDRIHEIVLEMTRYNVVFGIAIIFEIFAFILSLIVWYEDVVKATISCPDHVVYTILMVGKDFLFLQALHLSFKFSHSKYERQCKYCDNCMKTLCKKLIKKKQYQILRSMGKVERNDKMGIEWIYTCNRCCSDNNSHGDYYQKLEDN